MKKQKVKEEPKKDPEAPKEYEEDEELEEEEEEQEEVEGSNEEELSDEEWKLKYHGKLLELNDVEIQIKTQKRTILDTRRVDGLIPTNELLFTLENLHFEVSALKETLLRRGIDKRDLEDMEKKVEKGVKAYDLWTVK